jgi:hypothetical protein
LALVINFEEIDSCGGHYYSTTTLKAKLLDLIAKGKIARETQATLNAAKAKIEATCSAE